MGRPAGLNAVSASPGVTGWFNDRSFYFRDTLDDYHAIMIASGDATAKLWVTEFGWATYEGLKQSNGAAASANTQVGWQTLIISSSRPIMCCGRYIWRRSRPITISWGR